MTDDLSGKAKGGFARAEVLSPEKRREIAKKGAAARWEKKTTESELMAHVLEGFKSILDIAGTKLPCAVIQDANGIRRVLSENGITEAILGTRSGASKRLKKAAEEDGALLPLFLAPGQLKSFITEELLNGPLKPIDYLDGDRVVRGYEATVLATVCDVWLKARAAGALQAQQLPKAQQAEVLARALMQTGIVALVDEATGYQAIRPRDALQAYLEKIIAKELAAWVKTFPDEFYENIYKLKNWPWPGMSKNRYSVVAHYTNDLVYDRIAPGLRAELEKKNPKDEDGKRAVKNFQWLTSEIGHPLLAQHLYSLMMFQRLAIAQGYGWNRFLRMVDQVHPKKTDPNYLLPFPLEDN
jgi:hypothetical protein